MAALEANSVSSSLSRPTRLRSRPSIFARSASSPSFTFLSWSLRPFFITSIRSLTFEFVCSSSCSFVAFSCLTEALCSTAVSRTYDSAAWRPGSLLLLSCASSVCGTGSSRRGRAAGPCCRFCASCSSGRSRCLRCTCWQLGELRVPGISSRSMNSSSYRLMLSAILSNSEQTSLSSTYFFWLDCCLLIITACWLMAIEMLLISLNMWLSLSASVSPAGSVAASPCG